MTLSRVVQNEKQMLGATVLKCALWGQQHTLIKLHYVYFYQSTHLTAWRACSGLQPKRPTTKTHQI